MVTNVSLEDIIQAALPAGQAARNTAHAVLTGTGMATTAIEPFLTLRELSRQLQISTTSLWRWGTPAHFFGSRPRYRISEVEAYLASPEFQARTAELKAERMARQKSTIKHA